MEANMTTDVTTNEERGNPASVGTIAPTAFAKTRFQCRMK
jgi:hypothetical protein